jgi:hypothetical protein
VTYTGDERRVTNRDWSQRLGFWMLSRAGVWAVVVILHFTLLAVISVGVLLLNQNSSDEIGKLKQTAAGTNRIVQFIEVCITNKPEELTPEQKKDCGQDGSAQAIQMLFNYMNCAFQAVPATEAELNTCVQKATQH